VPVCCGFGSRKELGALHGRKTQPQEPSRQTDPSRIKRDAIKPFS